MQSKLLYIFSQYGCRLCPKPPGLRRQIESIAKCALLANLMAALCAISSGITPAERPFWQSYSAEDLYSLYMTLTATPGKVLSIIEEPIKAVLAVLKLLPLFLMVHRTPIAYTCSSMLMLPTTYISYLRLMLY